MSIINKDKNILVKRRTSVDGLNTAVRQLQQALLDGTLIVKNADTVSLAYLMRIFQHQGTVNLIRNSDFTKLDNNHPRFWSSSNANLAVTDNTLKALATDSDVQLAIDLPYKNMSFGSPYSFRCSIRASTSLSVQVFITDSSFYTNMLVDNVSIDTDWELILGSVEQLIDLTNTYPVNSMLPYGSQLVIRISNMSAQDWIELRHIALYEGQLALAWQKSLFDEIDIDEAIILDKLKSVDGHGSGLDADTVDGKHADEFALISLSNINSNNILNKLKSIDGHGSGLDADTVDGKHADEFADKNHNHSLSALEDVDPSAREDKRMLVWDDNLRKHVYVETPGASNELTNITSDFVLNKLKPVDGHGSGLDADTVDGKHATDFALISHNHVLSTLADVDASNKEDGKILVWKDSLNTHVYADPIEISTVSLATQFATIDLSNVEQNSLIEKLKNSSVSGLDADTVDGKHADEFADKNHNHKLSLLSDVSYAHQQHQTVLMWDENLRNHIYVPYLDCCTVKLPVRQYIQPYNVDEQFTLINFNFNTLEHSNSAYIYSDTKFKAINTGLYYICGTIVFVGHEGIGQRAVRLFVDDTYCGIGQTVSSIDRLPITINVSGVLNLEEDQLLSIGVAHTATDNIYLDTLTQFTIIFLRNI